MPQILGALLTLLYAAVFPYVLCNGSDGMTAVAVSTLADLTQSYRLYGVCNACHRMERINLLKLSLALGAAFPIMRVKTKLRCNKCDSRDCGIRIVWAGNG